ncbi:MAG: cystatin domain-containing protein [Planctomycetota bacterium]
MAGSTAQVRITSLIRHSFRLSMYLVLALGGLSLDGLLLARPSHAQVVGGYRPIAVTDKDAIAAAEFAVQAQAKNDPDRPKLELGKVTKAEVQIVAGRNFRLQMDVKTGGQVRRAQAVVWAKLDRTYELSKWEWLQAN